MEEKKSLKGTWTYLKKTYTFAKKDKKYLIYFILGCILYSTISIIAPLLSAKQIIALTNETWKQLFLITLVILGIEILRNIDRYFNNYFIDKYFYAVKRNIQIEVTKETLKINTKTLNNNSSGVFIERIGNDTDTLADIFWLIIDYITDIVTNIGILCSIFFLNKIIFLVYLLFLIILFFSQKHTMNKIQEKRKIVKKHREEVSGFISELVRGTKDIKILNSEKSFINKTDTIIKELGIVTFEMNHTRAKYRLINGNIRDILDFLIIILGMTFIIDGKLEVATMLIIFSYRGNILSISNNIESFLENITKYNLAAKRIFDIMDEEVFEKEKFGTKQIKKATGNIIFNDVTFAYENKTVLKNVNFEIQPNETVSFVGKSGSGKSTIFNLIAGLYYPEKGSILLDGINITDLDKTSIRGNLSIISQNPYIFNMTIKENFTIIKEDVTDEEIIKACKMACLHDFILTLKDGYNTTVGEAGVTLSGGQKQRLAIARALVQKTEIILFDEATSALDNETQAEIQKSIQNMQGKYTILIIAHRLSTVINSDRIILIDNGEVAGTGTHQELLEKNKIYHHLYEYELKSEKKEQ